MVKRMTLLPNSSSDCEGNVVQKLSTVIENQKQQLDMLMKLVTRLNLRPM